MVTSGATGRLTETRSSSVNTTTPTCVIPSGSSAPTERDSTRSTSTPPSPVAGPEPTRSHAGASTRHGHPDGKQIAFIILEQSGDGESVCTAAIDGTNLTQITHGNSEN